jgi:hypothetical protein
MLIRRTTFKRGIYREYNGKHCGDRLQCLPIFDGKRFLELDTCEPLSAKDILWCENAIKDCILKYRHLANLRARFILRDSHNNPGELVLDIKKPGFPK